MAQCCFFDGFIQLLSDAGCEVKLGKYISLKATGQKKFIRLRSLSADYSEDSIRQKIAGGHEQNGAVQEKLSTPIPKSKAC